MYEDYFTFRSLTVAQQGMQVLARCNIPAQLVRTPLGMQRQGCGFCIRVREPSDSAARWQLEHNSALYTKIFRFYENGAWEEIV